MNATDAEQIVVHPDEEMDAKLQLRLEQLIDEMPQMNRRTEIKLWLGSWIHPLGIHTWVRHKRYDAASDDLIDLGRVCAFCSKGLP